MSKNSNSNLQRNSPAILIAGISLFSIGIISFIFRDEPLTIIDLIYCILSIGISFFLLPLLFMVLGFVFVFPGANFIGAIIALIFLYNYPTLAIGIGIVISFIGISIFSKRNDDNISGSP